MIWEVDFFQWSRINFFLEFYFSSSRSFFFYNSWEFWNCLYTIPSPEYVINFKIPYLKIRYFLNILFPIMHYSIFMVFTGCNKSF